MTPCNQVNAGLEAGRGRVVLRLLGTPCDLGKNMLNPVPFPGRLAEIPDTDPDTARMDACCGEALTRERFASGTIRDRLKPDDINHRPPPDRSLVRGGEDSIPRAYPGRGL